MGREVRRVALDFNWPLRTIWDGYLNPHYRKCSACDGSGSTTAGDRLSALVGLILLSGEDAARGACHPYFKRIDGLQGTEGVPPSGDMVPLTAGLAGGEPSCLGYDALDQYSAWKKIVAAAGLDADKWGRCPICGGDGIDPRVREQYKIWQRTDPPVGEGWQMWETTSAGSPISPVFDSPEKLARWLADTGASALGGQTATYEHWLVMINRGWAPSAIGTGDGRLISGVEAAVDN